MLAMYLVLAVTGCGAILAADANVGTILVQPVPGPNGPMEGQRFEMKKEQIEGMLAKIREENPQKADELIRLRDKDPNAFRAELRKIMREDFGKKMMETAPWQHPGQPGQIPEMPGPGAEMWMGHSGAAQGPMREWMQQKQDEYLKWLKENYPDDAAKLEQLKGQNPEQFMRAMAISWKKYDKIFHASKDNPQLAAVLKEQMSLKEKRDDVLRQIRATTDEKQKKTLTGQLESIVSQQFDLIVKRKQLAYEDLAKKLTELQKEVDQRKAEAEKVERRGFQKAAG